MPSSVPVPDCGLMARRWMASARDRSTRSPGRASEPAIRMKTRSSGVSTSLAKATAGPYGWASGWRICGTCPGSGSRPIGRDDTAPAARTAATGAVGGARIVEVGSARRTAAGGRPTTTSAGPVRTPSASALTSRSSTTPTATSTRTRLTSGGLLLQGDEDLVGDRRAERAVLAAHPEDERAVERVLLLDL